MFEQLEYTRGKLSALGDVAGARIDFKSIGTDDITRCAMNEIGNGIAMTEDATTVGATGATDI